jgi:hypothetical protein
LAGSNPVKDDGFLRAIKIRSTTSFGGEVKPTAHVERFYGMLKNSVVYERYISSATFTDISRQVSPDSLRRVSTGIFKRALVDESE